MVDKEHLDTKIVSKEQLIKKLKIIVAENLKQTEEDIQLESSLVEDLKADSLDVVELVMALEEEFKLDIPDSDAENIKTFKDIVDFIAEKLDIKK